MAEPSGGPLGLPQRQRPHFHGPTFWRRRLNDVRPLGRVLQRRFTKMNRDSGNRPSFWVSLPGTITALTGLVVGIATLLGILYETGVFGKGEPEGTVTANNELPPTPIPAAMHAP